MILVSDVYSDVQRILGTCEDAPVYSRISDAVEILCHKTEIDPLLGWVDINTGGGRFVTLPREVETVLSLNISGIPSFPRNRWAEFHLNGRGSDATQSASYFWDDKGDYPTIFDPTEPVQLSVVAVSSDDVASGELWAYGYDAADKKIYTLVGGSLVEGWSVPLNSAPVAPTSDAPFFKRITAVKRTSGKGFMTLNGTADQASVPSLLGLYEPNDTLPKFRRISLSQGACWVRVQYRRKIYAIKTQNDFIPLHSKYALLLMCKALQKYDNDKIEEGLAYEKKALELLLDKQFSSNPQVSPTMQVSKTTTLVDPTDRLV